MEAALAPAPARVGALQTDAGLVAAVRRGDDRAFERLYARYHRRIAAYIGGMVKDHARAEDVTQDVFMSALRRLRATDADIAFKPWIYEIAKNACIDQFRRERRAEEVSFDADESLGGADYGRLTVGGPVPETALDHKQQIDHLCGAFGGLSEAHHQILVMRELEGLSYREIGDRMGMSRPSVESTLFRARRRLGEEWAELVSGRRCESVQAVLGSELVGTLASRERRRMSQHLSHCQPCRREAHRAGLSELVPERISVGARIAALLPLPAVLRRHLGGPGARGSGTYAEQAATWAKAVVAAGAVAVAGVGAGIAAHDHASTRAPAAGSRPHAAVAAAVRVGASAPRASGRHASGHGSGVRRAHVARPATRTTVARASAPRAPGAPGPAARVAAPANASAGTTAASDAVTLPGAPQAPAVPAPVQGAVQTVQDTTAATAGQAGDAATGVTDAVTTAVGGG